MFNFLKYIILVLTLVINVACIRRESDERSFELLNEIEARLSKDIFSDATILRIQATTVLNSSLIWLELAMSLEQREKFLGSFPEEIKLVPLDFVGSFPSGDNPEWWKPEEIPMAGIGSFATDADEPKAMSLYVIASEDPTREAPMYFYGLVVH